MLDREGRAFDQADWHEREALLAGQPLSAAFTHIGFFLDWLIRRGLTDPEAIGPDIAAAVERGELLGPDLHLQVAGALGEGLLTTDGGAFVDAYYGRYLDDYSAVFADEPPYGVAPTRDNADRIARVIDQRFAEWDYAGRPDLPPDDEPAEVIAKLLNRIELPPGLTREQLEGLSSDELVDFLTNLVDGRDRR